MTNQTVQIVNQNTKIVAAMFDSSRPWVVVKPAGFLNPILGHFATRDAAKKAADRFKKRNGL